MKEFCKRLVYWGQHGPTCWFNALLMATLYSQRSRNVLLHTIETLDDKIKIYKIFKHILKYKYVKSKKPEKDIKFFADITPENILQMLNQYNSNKFMFTEYKSKGFNADLYIKRFYKLVNADCLMILNTKDTIIYDPWNNISKVELTDKGALVTHKQKSLTYVYNKLARTPDILIVRINDEIKYKHYPLLDDENIRNIQSKNDVIKYNKMEYELDAVILNNYNDMDQNHSICGITCNGERYVYNGWTINTKDAAMKKKVQNRRLPCDLMKFDWNIKDNVEFCLNPRECELDLIYDKVPNDLCFSFSKGTRTLIYVKKGAGITSNEENFRTPDYKNLSSSKTKEMNKCGDGKIRDPVTKRCISMKTALKRGLVPDIPDKSPSKPVVKPKSPVVKPKSPVVKPKSPVLKPKSPVAKPCKDSNKIRDPRTLRCVSLKTAQKRGLIK